MLYSAASDVQRCVQQSLAWSGLTQRRVSLVMARKPKAGPHLESQLPPPCFSTFPPTWVSHGPRRNAALAWARRRRRLLPKATLVQTKPALKCPKTQILQYSYTNNQQFTPSTIYTKYTKYPFLQRCTHTSINTADVDHHELHRWDRVVPVQPQPSHSTTCIPATWRHHVYMLVPAHAGLS